MTKFMAFRRTATFFIESAWLRLKINLWELRLIMLRCAIFINLEVTCQLFYFLLWRQISIKTLNRYHNIMSVKRKKESSESQRRVNLAYFQTLQKIAGLCGESSMEVTRAELIMQRLISWRMLFKLLPVHYRNLRTRSDTNPRLTPQKGDANK